MQSCRHLTQLGDLQRTPFSTNWGDQDSADWDMTIAQLELKPAAAEMIRFLLPLSLGLVFFAPVPSSAAVLAEGKVSNGYYWQKTSTSSGSIRYNCRSTSSGKFQKHKKCKDAGAVKPN